jgi:DNA primase catalytic core
VAGRILKDDIETLRRQADIVAVVGDYTSLKRAGGSFKGLCPFHTERTPSFTVKQGDNVFHCFGCDASGDLYDFLMRIEGLAFPEAVEALARRTGFSLRYEELSARDREAIGERSRLVGVMGAAQRFFTTTLLGADGEVARTYLKERGFGREDVDRFDLGFAPNRWEDLSRALTAEGYRPDDLVTTGLAVRNPRGGLRDRFRGRLIFPVHDPGGDVIGFGGRILPALDYGDFDPPKYLNSPETPLYKKTRVLYGVKQARPDIVRAEQVLVCEGYTDVMALHQAGFGNAVATCGTAVGLEHLRLVSRYAQRVILAFDADEAGVKAAERAWEAARSLAGAGEGGAALELRVLVLPDGRDPADLVREVGAEGLQRAVSDATPVVPFVIRHRLATADLGSEAGRTAALRDVLEIVGREPDPTCGASGPAPRSPSASASPTTSWRRRRHGRASRSTGTRGWRRAVAGVGPAPEGPPPPRRVRPGVRPTGPAPGHDANGTCSGSRCRPPSCCPTSGSSSRRTTSATRWREPSTARSVPQAGQVWTSRTCSTPRRTTTSEGRSGGSRSRTNPSRSTPTWRRGGSGRCWPNAWRRRSGRCAIASRPCTTARIATSSSRCWASSGRSRNADGS